MISHLSWGFPVAVSGKEPTCQCRRLRRWSFDPWVGKIPWRRKWQYSCLGDPRTEETGGLQSMGSPRIGHYWASTCDMDTVTHPQLRASVHAFSFARKSPAYLWNPTQLETTIYSRSWILWVRNADRHSRHNLSWLHHDKTLVGKTWIAGVIEWLNERNVQGCLHSLEIAPLKISLTFDAWARLIEKCHSTWLSTEAPKQICPMWPWLPTAW